MKTPCVYFLTNKNRTILYCGVTNNIQVRLHYHYYNWKTKNKKSYTAKYNCIYLIYTEAHPTMEIAIQREKQLKTISKTKKWKLILTQNRELKFHNEKIMNWPPADEVLAAIIIDPKNGKKKKQSSPLR